MDAETTYTSAQHVITNPLGLKVGDQLDGPLFPRGGMSRVAGLFRFLSPARARTETIHATIGQFTIRKQRLPARRSSR